MRVAVIGAGYVGLVQSAGLAYLGHRVALSDIDATRIHKLRQGEIPIFEQGLPDLLQRGVSQDLVSFHSDNLEAVRDSEVVFLTVPTPESPDGRADLTAVWDVVDQIAPHLPARSLLVTKSTVPVGTADRIRERLRDAGCPAEVAANPEFLREGSAVDDFLRADRIVVGTYTPEAAATVSALYRGLGAEVVTTDPTSAELIKYGSNAYLAARLTFVNSLANLADAVGADILDVVGGMGLDPRIGPLFLKPGPGYGGSCFPKDTAALVRIAEDAGYDFSLLRAVIEADEEQRRRIAERVRDLVGGSLAGRVVGMWGVAFKAGTDDTRGSPAVRIAQRLERAGASVRAYDPEARDPGVELVESPLAAAKEADALVVATEWPEFARVDMEEVASVMRGTVVFDTRHLLDARAVRGAGLEYYALGRPRA